MSKLEEAAQADFNREVDELGFQLAAEEPTNQFAPPDNLTGLILRARQVVILIRNPD